MRVVIGAVVGVLMVTLLLSTPLLGALDLIGFSMISPPPAVDFFGLAIKPRIPVN